MTLRDKKETIFGTLIRFSLPLILSGILQQLYNWVDAFIIGNVNGEIELAAIGATNTISSLLSMSILGFTLGISVYIAQKYGSGEKEDIVRILATFTILIGLVYALLAILGIVLTRPVLQLMNTTKETIDYAEAYLRIIFMGIPFLAVYNSYCAALRGIGDSRSPFISIIFSSVVNTVLDILFVAVFRWGIKGAAAATVISQISMTIFLIIYANRKHSLLRIHRTRNLFDREILRTGLGFGLPPMIQSSITAVGSLILQKFMNGFGTQTVTAITTAYRIDTVLLLPIINLGAGISTLVAQSYGANDQPRTRKILKQGTLLMIAVSLSLTLFIIFMGDNMISLFGVGQEAVKIGQDFFIRLSSFYVVFGIGTAMRGYLEGVGNMVFSSVIGITGLGCRIIASYAMEDIFGNMVIAYAEMFSWSVLLLLFTVQTFRKMKALKSPL